MENKRIEILKTAQSMIQKGGYNSFSFRGIADAVKIKSSSVHYYYKKKEDLVVAVVEYYTNNFMDSLEEKKNNSSDPNSDMIEIYIKVFTESFNKNKNMCLCGLLGSEINYLPESIRDKIKIFFARNIDWLVNVYSEKGINKKDAIRKSKTLLGLLEGAMILNQTMENDFTFDYLNNIPYIKSVLENDDLLKN